MLSKTQLFFIRSLQLKKNRDKHGLFVAEGEKVVNELLASSWNVNAVYVTTKGINRLLSTTVPVHEIETDELEKISVLSSPNEVVCIAKIPDYVISMQEIKKGLVLALDSIRDPGNLGTIIRIADWFGIAHIICSEDCVDAYNPKVIQATMGSIARVKVFSTFLPDFLKQVKDEDFPVYGAMLSGKSIFKTQLNSKGILLLGNEAAGISPSLYPFITKQIAIPRFGGAESLNVAVAAAIICAEFKR